MPYKNSYTASEAKKDFFNLIRKASLHPIEIRLKDQNPVILTSKANLESLKETVEILSIPGARESILEGFKETRLISHQEMLKKIGLKSSSTSKK
ncbi:MAG: hypothetical protein HYS86_03370 [Candidatus Chisholmbacteria bacterium]|nr:hypothetical protein [Candidatus Chisholmbacteria bacterium]